MRLVPTLRLAAVVLTLFSVHTLPEIAGAQVTNIKTNANLRALAGVRLNPSDPGDRTDNLKDAPPRLRYVHRGG